MRFIPISGLADGMKLAKSIYDINRTLLLRKNSIITDNYINRIKLLGYHGVYIDDVISEDIVVNDIIADDLRQRAITSIRETFLTTKNSLNEKDKDERIDKTKELVYEIVDNILVNKDAMYNLLDLKIFDDYTYSHSVNVTVITILIGTELKLPKDELFELGLSALLHDIGKIYIDKSILNKPARLTDEEYKQIQNHPAYGYRYLKATYNIPFKSYMAIYEHHERYDGRGYPLKNSGTDIPLFSRIIAIADVFDALTSKRPYREPISPSEAMEYIMSNGGIMFDPELIKIFAHKVSPYPVGTYAKLSNNSIGIIVRNYPEACLRPQIKIVIDSNGKRCQPYIIDLNHNKSFWKYTIVSLVDNIDITDERDEFKNKTYGK